MPWRDPRTVPFSRIGVVSSVPSDSGVFAILSGEAYVLVSDSWNLKARLLDLISVLNAPEHLSVKYELCPEAERPSRLEILQRESLAPDAQPAAAAKTLPGLTFWSGMSDGFEPAASDGADV